MTPATPATDAGALADELETTMRHARIFITSREKMNPIGVPIFDEIVEKVVAALRSKSAQPEARGAHQCKTDGAVFEIEIDTHRVLCVVFLPQNVKAIETDDLKKRMHDAMEDALAPLFPQYAALLSPDTTVVSSTDRGARGLVAWPTSGSFLGYRDEHGNEMHCRHVKCPHETDCRKGCDSPTAVSSNQHSGEK